MAFFLVVEASLWVISVSSTGGLFCFSGINYTTESISGNGSVGIPGAWKGALYGMGTKYTELLHTLLA
jgi:hypothetical protein